MTHETMSFEKAFERLEQILEIMNGGKTPLQESLTLFEEAEKLIRSCSTRLTQAEQKIEMLIKGRSGEVLLDEAQKPQTQPYSPNTQTQAAPAFTKTAPTRAAPVSQTMDDLPF